MLHPSNLESLKHLSDNPPQSLLIGGQAGLSFESAVKKIVGDFLVVTIIPRLKDGSESDKGAIFIEQIREIVHDARIKHTNKHFVVMYGADKMTPQAQNAFLKLLEEPGANSYYILCSTSPDALLPTIKSRVQRIDLLPLPEDSSLELLAKHGVSDQSKRSQLIFMASGLPDELVRLADDETYYDERAGRMKDAQQLLQAAPYERIKIIHRYKSGSSSYAQLVDDAIGIIGHTMKSKPSDELVDKLELLLDISNNLSSNANPRLQLLRLVI